jgi:acetyl esterase/lipase
VKNGIDPELAPFVPFLPELDLTDVTGMRRILAELTAKKKPYESPVALTVEERLATVGEAGVKVRTYRPSATDAPLPAILYMHGGGFVSGGLDMSDTWARRHAAEVGAVVLSVDYRLAQEHVFPAALDDCYTALEWVVTEAARLGVDAARIAVAGDSAGANLAAATAIRARDSGGPEISHQSLSIPGLDDRLDTPAARASTATPLWRTGYSEHTWSYYLGAEYTRGSEDVPALAAPARVKDLSNLPSAFIAACDFDPHRDEAIEFGMRLAQADVRTELHLYPGTFHASRMFEDAEVSRRMIRDCVDALRRALS